MKVSIAIPCYNTERWLRQCIESALGQRGVEAEVLVVDDGSTDGSREIARSFGDRIQLIEGPHSGANASRNAALRKASGEWIQFLDADDYLEPQKIETQLAEARGDADVLYSPVWIESSSGRELSRTSPDADLDIQWIRWHIPQTGGALWRREPLLALGGWREGQPCCQEHELYLRARMAGLRFVYTPTPGAVYRIWSEETLCRKDPVQVVRVRTALMDSMAEWLVDTGRMTPDYRREIGRACFEMARTLARSDLAAAAAYHKERQSKELVHLEGPAAPHVFRLLYKLFGFVAAERIAKAMRRTPS